MRSFNRSESEMRPVMLTPNVSRHAEGSCLVECGHTKVLCTASVEDHVPPFLRNTGKGWVSAEYGMLPRATGTRNLREASKGKQGGRTMEIQRLIGRSLRATIDFKKLGERQILIDCDVLEADGGTRTASITGGYVALNLACAALMKQGLIRTSPILGQVAAISCGILGGKPLLDLDYEEDSAAEVDSNFVYNSDGKLIEVQGTAEEAPFSEEELIAMMRYANQGTQTLIELQKKAITQG